MSDDLKPLLRVLKGERVNPPPIWIMRQAGRYLPEYRELRKQVNGFVDFCLRPDIAAEATLQPLRRFDLDASIVFADILLIPMAMGQRLAFEEGLGPVLDPLQTHDIAKLKTSNVTDRLAAVGETLVRVKDQLLGHVALIGFAGAPWTVAAYMIEGGTSRDFWNARLMAWREPEAMASLLEVLVEATADYLVMQAEAGAEVLKLFDSWGGGLPEPLFDQLVIAPTKALIGEVRARGVTVPIIGFPRGAGALTQRYAQMTGVDALALDQGMEARWAADRLQTLLPVQGHLDPACLAAGGEAMETEALRLVEAYAGGPHIFNLGHGVTPQTPPEHVAALVKAVKTAHG